MLLLSPAALLARKEGDWIFGWEKKTKNHKISISFKKKLHQEDTHLHPPDEDVMLKLVVVPRVATWKERGEDRSWSRSTECRLPSGGTQDVPKVKRRSQNVKFKGKVVLSAEKTNAVRLGGGAVWQKPMQEDRS